MPNLSLVPGTLSNPNCWPSSPQAYLNEIMSISIAVQATGLTGVIVSDTEPAVTDRDKVWVRTSAGAPVFPSTWIFHSGLWISPHPIPAGSLWAMPYTGTIASIPILDGGAAGAVSDNSGPFWEAVASLAARMPIGAGTLPSGTVLAVGDTGGEEAHVLSAAEAVGTATLKVTRASMNKCAGGNTTENLHDLTLNGVQIGGHVHDGPDMADVDIPLGNAAVNAPHNTMPPYVALTFLRRTARKFCTQPIA